MEIFGSFERLIDDLYPYRWPLLGLFFLGAFVVLRLVLVSGLPGWLARHKLAATLFVVPFLAIVVPLSYYLLSPLWTRTSVFEESPLATSSGAAPQATVSLATPRSLGAPTSTPVQSPTTPAPSVIPHASATPTLAGSMPTHSPSTNTSAPVATATAIPTSTPEPLPTSTPEPVAFEPRIVRSGTLTGADDFHFAEGTVLLIEVELGRFVLRLEDVSVRNGPDLFVYLSPSSAGIVEGAVNLGELKATDGSFNYDVPVEYDIAQFQGVIIWCRAFAVLFGTAPLR